jgi:hypothetical protein
MSWENIADVATAVSALAVAVTAIFAFLQLKGLRMAQEVTVALALHDRSTTPELLKAGNWLKTQMPADFSYAQYLSSSDARERLNQLWYYFEFVGVLVDKGYLSEDLIFDQQGAFIAGVWDRSQELINARRVDRKSPQYMENFEILRNRFVKWAACNRPKLAPTKVRRARGYYQGEYRATPDTTP